MLNLGRPPLLDDENEKRSQYQQARQRLLDEDFDELMLRWIAENAGEEATQRMGIPDTAMNPIASNTRQLVTPGLYGEAPSLTYDPASEPLLGKDGVFERSGFWPRSQTLQYYVVGMGVYLRFLNVIDEGRGSELVDRLVHPANVVAFCREYNPMSAYAIWELRCRTYLEKGKRVHVWVWDQYNISDPKNPTFRVLKANTKGEPTKDLTRHFVEDPAVYPWLDPDGNGFLPFVVYRSIDTGSFWPHYKRGMHRGTLRACEHWTYTSRSALFATGEHVIIAGLDTDAIPGVGVKRGDDNIQQSAVPQLNMAVTPGMLTFLPTSEGRTIQAVHIGPGANLPNLANFSNMYNMALAVNDGLHPTDATRQSANPTSGSALEISNESRRQYSNQVRPFALAADIEAITKVSWMFRSLSIDYPVTGLSISYKTIPLTPTEREDLRADLEWQEEQGIMSPVDVYLALNPGQTREQARKAVVAARIEKAEIDAEVEKATGIPTQPTQTDLNQPNNPKE